MPLVPIAKKSWDWFSDERVLFSILIALELIYFGWVIAYHRFPAGHDTFQYFSLQYYFLNNAVFSGEIPQWMPYMTQGAPASWWQAIVAGWMQQVYCLMGPYLLKANFYYLFMLGMFVDELILLLGCWLWSRMVLSSSLGRFIFTASVTFSAMWWNQPWHNFHLYYALPLVLYFLHCFFVTGKWRYVFLSGSLLLMAQWGNMPYFLPAMSFCVFIYCCAYLSCNLPLLRNCGKFLFNWRALLVLGALALLAWGYVWVMTWGTDSIVNYNLGRSADGTTTLKEFLSYGGHNNWSKLKELFLGFSPEIDYTLYSGMLVVPMILAMAIYYRNWQCLPALISAIIMLDFSQGGWTAQIAYYVWPMMSYFRHISLSLCLAKLFICLLSALGFEYFLSKGLLSQTGSRPRIGVIAVLLGVLAIMHSRIDRDTLDQIIVDVTYWGRSRLFDFEAAYAPFILGHIKVIFILCVLLTVLFFLYAWIKNSRVSAWIIMLIVFFHVGDVYLYKFYETRVRSIDVTPWMDDLEFTPMRFYSHRLTGPWHESRRAGIINHMPMNHYLYWSNDSFLMRDPVGHDTRTDHWLKPLDQLMRYYWGMDMDDISVRPKGLTYLLHLDFPLEDPSAALWSGVSKGKLLFVDRPAHLGDEQNAQPAAYTLKSYSANHAIFEVTNPNSETKWLFYSQVAHKGWRASIDGREAQIHRAAIAYQSVPVPAGTHEVTFSFYDHQLALIQVIFAWVALLWIVVIIGFCGCYMFLRS